MDSNVTRALSTEASGDLSATGMDIQREEGNTYNVTVNNKYLCCDAVCACDCPDCKSKEPETGESTATTTTYGSMGDTTSLFNTVTAQPGDRGMFGTTSEATNYDMGLGQAANIGPDDNSSNLIQWDSSVSSGDSMKQFDPVSNGEWHIEQTAPPPPPVYEQPRVSLYSRQQTLYARGKSTNPFL